MSIGKQKDLLLESNRRLQETAQRLSDAKKALEKKNQALKESLRREKSLEEELKDLRSMVYTPVDNGQPDLKEANETYKKAIINVIKEKDESADIAKNIADYFYSRSFSAETIINTHLLTLNDLTKGQSHSIATELVIQGRLLLIGVLLKLVDLHRN